MSKLSNRLYHYALLMRIHKPIGIFLVLWPTLWALWFAAGGLPDVKVLVIFCVGVFLMRSAGCVINDFADRKFDGHVTRTKTRPLVTGDVSSKEALGLFAVLVTIAFLLVLQLNRLTILLSFVAVFLASWYPFCKRFTHLPQFVLGLAFAWAVPMAFAAQTGTTIPVIAWWVYLAAVLWPVAYDTLYAMVDRDDDLKIGVKSTAILFGQWDKTIVAILQAVVLLTLVYVGVHLELAVWFFLSLFVAAGLFAWHHYLIYARDPQQCFKAFLQNNWVGLVIFVGIVLG